MIFLINFIKIISFSLIMCSCFNNLSRMNYMNIVSNTFEKNEAVNGGALYLKDEENDYLDDDQYILNIENNIFRDNNADNFGGAIYSEFSKLYLASSNNNTIIENRAGIMGGGLYSPSSIHKNLFNFNNSKIENNYVYSYSNNFSSKPSYIVLDTEINENIEIVSGGNLSLLFYLYDEFNNTVYDVSNFYRELSIKVILIEKNKFLNINEEYENDKSNYHILSNICSFNNGKVI